MEQYRKRNSQNRLQFIDISGESFCAEEFGKTKAEFMQQLHVRDADGNYTTGIDAFISIWNVYPSGSPYRLFSALIGLPGVELFSRFGYRLFARYRHLLQRKKRDCETGSCNLNHPR